MQQPIQNGLGAILAVETILAGVSLDIITNDGFHRAANYVQGACPLLLGNGTILGQHYNETFDLSVRIDAIRANTALRLEKHEFAIRLAKGNISV
jgi:hypothetical protein